MGWDKVRAVLPEVKAAVWDGCHKIYLALDDQQAEKYREAGYSRSPAEIVLIEDKSPETLEELMDTIKDWYERSCFLSFVDATRTTSEPVNSNEFTEWITLIEQTENPEDEKPPVAGSGRVRQSVIDASAHVLFVAGMGGKEPGGFTTKLIEALFHADRENLAVVESVYPELARAVDLYKNSEAGLATLRELAALDGKAQ